MITLRELLEEDGYTSTSDAGILVHGPYGDMAVSHRYLSGGWNDILNSNAARMAKGEYVIIPDL